MQTRLFAMGRLLAGCVLVALAAGISAQAATALIIFDAPHGGEVYAVGQTQQIQIHGTAFKSLSLELSRDGGTTFEAIGTLAVTSRTSNSFAWTVTGPSTSNALVRATGTAASGPYIVLSSPFSITTSAPAVGAIQTGLADGSVTTPKIADAAVTTPKIADFSVTSAKMNSSSSSTNFLLAADGAGGAQWVSPAAILPTGGSPYVLKSGDTLGSNSGPSLTTILGTTSIQGSITNINTIGPLGTTVIGNSTSTTTLNGSVTFANPPSIKLPKDYIWVGAGDVQTPYGPGPAGNALTIVGTTPTWSTSIGSPVTAITSLTGLTTNINTTAEGSPSQTNINSTPAFGGSVLIGNVASPVSLCTSTILGDTIVIGDPKSTVASFNALTTNMNSTAAGSPSLTNINTFPAVGGTVNIGNIAGTIQPGLLAATVILGDRITTGSARTAEANMVAKTANINSTFDGSTSTTNINADPVFDLTKAFGGTVNMGNITGINNIIGLKTNVNSTMQGSPSTTNINTDINSDPTLDSLVKGGAVGGIVNIGNITGTNNVVGLKTNINSTKQASPTTTNINADINSDPTLNPIVLNGATGGIVNIGNITGTNNIVGVVTNVNSTLAGSPSTVNINNAPATGGAVNIGNLDPACTAQVLANMITIGDILGLATTEIDLNGATVNINTSNGLSAPTLNLSTLNGSTINLGYTDKSQGASTTNLSGDFNVTNYTGITVQNNLSSGFSLNSNSAFMTFNDSSGKSRGDISGESIVEHISDPQFILDTSIAALNVAIGVADVILGVAAFLDAANPFDTPIAIAVGIGAVADGVVAVLSSVAYFIDIGIQLSQVGVAYNSTGADYAEFLQRDNPQDRFFPGDIVGVKNGRISKHTEGCQNIMSISQNPIVLGNAPSLEQRRFFNKVAFMGQVPAKVRGRVNPGDFIIASGLNDGVGIAISPDAITPEQFEMVLGRAWTAVNADDEKISFVKVAVGLNAKSMSEMLRRDHTEIQALKKEVEALRTNHPAPATNKNLEDQLEALKTRLEKLERK